MKSNVIMDEERSGNVAYHVASVVKSRKRLYINVFEMVTSG